MGAAGLSLSCKMSGLQGGSVSRKFAPPYYHSKKREVSRGGKGKNKKR